MKKTKRLSTNSGFVAFGDYFGRFSILFWEVISTTDITPQKRIEKRLKRTAKSTEAEFVDSL
jgi:hypothetical protein